MLDSYEKNKSTKEKSSNNFSKLSSIETNLNSIYSINPNYDRYINFKLENFNSLGNCSFIIDTGADISLIKFKKDFQNEINENETIKIRGISDDASETLGTINLNLIHNGFLISHTFHVVPNNFPIPTTGIIGDDFLDGFCIIDRIQNNLIVDDGYKRVKIPIHVEPCKDIFFIPAKSEAHKKLPKGFINEDSVVLSNEPKPGVFVGRTIISRNNPLISIVNTNNYPVLIPHNRIVTDKLKNYNIFNIKRKDNVTINSNKKQEILRKVMENKENANLDTETKEKLKNLIVEYLDIFHSETENLTVNNFFKQKIKLKNNEPTYVKQYRLPHSQKNEIKRQIEEGVKQGIFEPSNSVYNSPVLLVDKKKSQDGKVQQRVVIDYRILNKSVIPDKFPIRRIEDIFDSLYGSTLFSIIDLQSGFYQIELDEESRHLTSFTIDDASYQMRRSPMGLISSPNSFQRMMTLAFSGVCPERAFIYMDDLIIFSKDLNSHLDNLRLIFETCRTKNLKLNASKCTFLQNSVTYCGHTVSKQGISIDSSKTEAIRKYPTPTNADETKRFVAFANYYRKFIRNFAQLCIPLNNLTRKNVNFKWTEDHQYSFNEIKNQLLQMPILNFPDFSKEFIVTTDASNLACGAVISQIQEGNDVPIAFASKSFTPGESHKSVIEKELTAIHWAINKFRPYLYGYKFKVRTDHKPLVYLFSMKDPSSKLTRMRLDLEEYNFETEYVKGSENSVSDALSRISIDTLKEIRQNVAKILVITRNQAKKAKNNLNELNQKVNSSKNIETDIKTREVKKSNLKAMPYLVSVIDGNLIKIKIMNNNKILKKFNIIIHECDRILGTTRINCNCLTSLVDLILNQINKLNINKLKINKNNSLFKLSNINDFTRSADKILNKCYIYLFSNPIQIVDLDKQKEILSRYHDDPVLGGHTGIRRTFLKINEFYKWHNMKEDITNYIKKCKQCQLNKIKNSHVEELNLTPVPDKPFYKCQIDTVGPFVKSVHNYTYAVTIICELTKYLVVIPIENKEAMTIAKAIFENFILIYGNFHIILTDKGSEYVNELQQNISKLFNFTHVTSTAYHHQTLGTIERSHRELNFYLRNYLDSCKATNWCEWAKLFAFFYNVTPSSYHGYTPYELVFGRKAKLLGISSEISPIYNIDDYSSVLRHTLQMSNKKAQEILQKFKISQKAQYDKKAKPQNLEENQTVMIRNNARTNKLDSPYKGPYKITKILDAFNIEIEDSKGKSKVLHKNEIFKVLLMIEE